MVSGKLLVIGGEVTEGHHKKWNVAAIKCDRECVVDENTPMVKNGGLSYFDRYTKM